MASSSRQWPGRHGSSTTIGVGTPTTSSTSRPRHVCQAPIQARSPPRASMEQVPRTFRAPRETDARSYQHPLGPNFSSRPRASSLVRPACPPTSVTPVDLAGEPVIEDNGVAIVIATVAGLTLQTHNAERHCLAGHFGAQHPRDRFVSARPDRFPKKTVTCLHLPDGLFSSPTRDFRKYRQKCRQTHLLQFDFLSS
jgi:hypothetical protein